MDIVLKLHKCYRLQGILGSDVISKVDFLTKPYATLAIAVALHGINITKKHGISYSDVVSLQRKIAHFLLKADKNEVEFLEKLVSLTPSKLGFDVATVSRRCLIDYQKITDLIKLLNMLKESISLASLASQQTFTEVQKKPRVICLSNTEMLPPLNVIAESITRIILMDLENSKEINEDPYFTQLMDSIKRKLNESKLTSNDIAAFSLVLITIMRHYKDSQICVEPGIDVETLARKMYNDLTSVNADPSKSDIYAIYQEIASRSVMKR